MALKDKFQDCRLYTWSLGKSEERPTHVQYTFHVSLVKEVESDIANKYYWCVRWSESAMYIAYNLHKLCDLFGAIKLSNLYTSEHWVVFENGS